MTFRQSFGYKTFIHFTDQTPIFMALALLKNNGASHHHLAWESSGQNVKFNACQNLRT